MPSFSYTPGAVVYAGGDFFPEPIRFSFVPARVTLGGGTFAIGPTLSPGISNDLAAVTDTLFASEALVDEQGRPSRRFQQIWQNTIEALVSVVTSQGASITELEAIYAGINAAQATAATAVQTANATQAAIDLSGSFIDPVGALTAASSGTIAIAAHDRVYTDGTRVSVNSGSVSGFAGNDYVTVFYSDPARAGGAVTYSGTTSAIAQSGDIHIVGQVIVPEAGQSDAPGTGPTAPGYTAPNPYYYDPRMIGYDPY